MNSIIEEKDVAYTHRAINNQHQANLELLDRLKENRASEEDLLLLTNILSDDFSRNGLNNNDEPNDYGLRLEAIIDKLSAWNKN